MKAPGPEHPITMEPGPQQPDRCPLCQQGNQCAVAAGDSDASHCWCMELPFPDAAVPGSAVRACLCQACVQRLAAAG